MTDITKLRTLCNNLGLSCREANGSFIPDKKLQTMVHAAKSQLIDKWYDVFRKYPEVFPDAYFRFLKANLEESFKKGNFIESGPVLLTWKQYQKGTDYAEKGDFSLEKMVSSNPGDGSAQRVIEQFLRKVPRNSTCYLKVAKNNNRAICFYKKNGFRTVKALQFGSVPGLLMSRVR